MLKFTEWWWEEPLVNLKHRWRRNVVYLFSVKLSIYLCVLNCQSYQVRFSMHNSKLRCTHRTVCNLAGWELKSIFCDQGKNEMVSSHDSNHFIFLLAYLSDIFQQLNKVILKLQRRGRTIVDFTDTSAHSWKNLTIGSEKFKQEILLVRESCHSGWWWNKCWYSIESCSTPWRDS